MIYWKHAGTIAPGSAAAEAAGRAGPRPITVAQDFQLEEWLRVVRSEYFEMPGLRLTLAQSQRLWGLDRARAETLLSALVETEFLKRDAKGMYSRSAGVSAY